MTTNNSYYKPHLNNNNNNYDDDEDDKEITRVKHSGLYKYMQVSAWTLSTKHIRAKNNH